MRHIPIDLSTVTTYPIKDRKNKMVFSRDCAAPVSKGMSVDLLLSALPRQLGAESLLSVIDAVVAARKNGKPVIMAIGGHVIKCGLQPVLKALI
jgi:hypothetical protein